MFGSVMRYLAGIHDAWERRYPDNHDRISRLSVPTQLQCTRGDLASLATIPVDYAVPIVALIIDCTHSTKWTVSACMVTTRMHGSCTMFAAVIPSSSSARRVQFRFSWGHGLHDPCMGRNGSLSFCSPRGVYRTTGTGPTRRDVCTHAEVALFRGGACSISPAIRVAWGHVDSSCYQGYLGGCR